MPTPRTFSQGSETLEPSIEDALRDGIWIMLRADDGNRKTYSFDDDEPAAGIRIYSGVAHVDPSEGRIIIPQQIVTVAVASNRLAFETTGDASKRVTIAIAHLERPETGYLEVDVDAPAITPEARLARTEEILMRGTLFIEDMATNNGRVIDPYRSPIYDEDTAATPDDVGLYIPEEVRYLNELLPEVVRAQPLPIRLRAARTQAEALNIDPVTDLAVVYSLLATYTISIGDRENLRLGGFSNG
jgi:hypothetical protein